MATLEQLEIRTVQGFDMEWEVVMSNKDGYWFPVVVDTKTTDKITGKRRVMPRVAKFLTYGEARDWVMGTRYVSRPVP